MRIIVHGSHFSFYLAEEWIAECEDETLPSGEIGFAAQNYSDKDTAGFTLRQFSVESRPGEVEKAYYRWTKYIPQSAQYRVNLARTLMLQANYPAAAVQLKRALYNRTGSAEEHLLLGKTYLNLGIYKEALAEISASLEVEPGSAEALTEKAKILYLDNRFAEAKDALMKTADMVTRDPLLSNLLGNVHYALGDWVAARDSYRNATVLGPAEPLFHSNSARALERMFRTREAIDEYRRAANLLFELERFDELSTALARLRKLGGDSGFVRAVEAKVKYSEGDTREAGHTLQSLVDRGYDDASVFHLLGLLASEDRNRDEALRCFRCAAALEPLYFRHWFRIAETLYLVGRDGEPEISRAHALNPSDPWVNNLRGLFCMRRARYREAKRCFEEALACYSHGASVQHEEAGRADEAAAPSESKLLINLSESMCELGECADALTLLRQKCDAGLAGGDIHNHIGNILLRLDAREAAADAYEHAVEIEPANTVYLMNCATASMAIDRITRAEGILERLVEDNPTCTACNLLGNVARMKGERSRAELCYRKGIDLDPANQEVKLNLADLLIETQQYGSARTVIAEVLRADPECERARQSLTELRRRSELRISCSSCRREWWVPAGLPHQPLETIRGEVPDEAPAGICPDCGRIYCIQCARGNLVDGRFLCADCDTRLKLSENSLRYLVNRYLTNDSGSDI